MLTATQILDQAMQAAGNARIATWALRQLNVILRDLYRAHTWPFLVTLDTSLATVDAQAYTDYSALTDFWKPKIIQIYDGTNLHPITPRKGGWTAYLADTSRLTSSARPSKYVIDRANSRIYWADSIPNAAETIYLAYQQEVADVGLSDTPTILSYVENGERYLIFKLLMDIKIYLKETSEAAALGPLVKQYEDALLSERREDTDDTPQEHGNAAYA